MSITLGSTYVVKLFSFCNGQLGLNVLHYRCTLLIGPAPAETSFAVNVENAFSGPLTALLSSQASYLGVNIQQILPVLGLPSKSTVFAGPGGGGTPVLPKQVAGLVTKRSDLGGRHNRGRCYLPFPSEADNASQGVPEVAYVGLLQTFAIQMISVISVGGSCNMSPIIFRKDLPAQSALITGYTTANRWANQHRRGDYGALNVSTVPG